MITKEQAIDLCKAKEINVRQMLDVIQRYILELKGQSVKIKMPEDTVTSTWGKKIPRMMFQQMYKIEINKINIAFSHAQAYFL